MDEEDVNKHRYEKLGFRPQKENVYNKFLPYAEKLDQESAELFINIKTNLVKSVLAREMRPGFVLWSSRLNKYMKIYGMKFSKEDHISLIKLYYELLTIPDLIPTRINKCAATLTHLLKKRYLISRDELQLDWRPLYKLCVRITVKSKTEIGMYRCFSILESTIIHLIRLARIYFPASATQEILDEFKPELCPISNDIVQAVGYLEIFLPVYVKPEEASISYHLWFTELMDLWNECQNATSWEDAMMWLIARVANFNMGYIDWEPYIPLMFVRFLRTFQLPVAYRQKQTYRLHKIEISSMAIWITSALNGNKNSTFFHLEKFMQALETYYYPANTGRWCIKLRELLRKLAYYFVQRVHNERFRKPSWENETPDHYKLTDKDIDRFVNIMKPCVEQAMFSNGGQEINLALQYLGSLRPNLIVPMTVDNLYDSMDSLTEPHKLTASMMGVTAVARYMVQGAGSSYPEGVTHVLPLLTALLPGIDPNDMRKCLVTFNFMVHFINMVPLVNSSEASNYHQDLTEEEHIVCEASAGFEDFVLQFFDRLCLWVESNSLDFIRHEEASTANNNNPKNRAEVIAESALFAVISAVLQQCSSEIFTAALKKVFNFVCGRILETQISGKMVAIICQGFTKVNPKEALKLFVPYLCGTIERLMEENPNLDKEEVLDAEFLYNMQILSELLDGRSEILNYADRITVILDKTLHMTSIIGNQMGARMLDLIMSSLTNILPTEYRTCPQSYDTHVKEFLPIREWGKAQKIADLKLSWYVPGDKDIDFVQKLINRYLLPELEKLNKHADGVVTVTREGLRRSLKIVISILSSHSVLPLWDEPAIEIVDSVLEPWAFNLVVSNAHTVNMPDGKNVRKVIADTMQKLQQKILHVDEGDTKTLQNIIHIYNILLFNKSRSQDFEYHWKNFHILKKLLEDRLHQNKLHLRYILINRVMLQQQCRIEGRSCSFTDTHKNILLNLFELSVSRYSEVRKAAQQKLVSVVSYFPYSYTVLTPKLLETLRLNSVENHEKFKACLYILIGPKNTPIVARHDWEFIKELWPLIVTSMPSEKPSIINLINAVFESVNRFFPTIAICFSFPQKCLDAAHALGQGVPKVSLEGFQDVIKSSEEALKVRCAKRKQAYNDTVDALLNACIKGNLHWRYHSMAVGFIKVLVHYDVKYNIYVIKYFLQALNNESINIRKTALKVVLYILIQNKPKFKKITLDPYEVSHVPKPSAADNNSRKLSPGIRADNKWLLYDTENLPRNSADWNKTSFLHHHSYGYYVWPKELKTYAPPNQQPHIDDRMDKLTPEEQEIFEFFNDHNNLNQFFKYFSMEEKKGKDQFNAYKYLIFKNLFKIYEDKLLEPIMGHLQTLVTEKNESSQRCASEIISGLIRGSKHWPYEKVEKMWQSVLPVLQTAILNMCSDTHTDWGVCMAMALDSRDPNRHHWILEFLAREPLISDEQTSFVTCGRLHMLQAAIYQQSWRNTKLSLRLYEYFKQHLSHPFQNIREKICCCLTMIFNKSWAADNVPTIKSFFDQVMPTLNGLYVDSLAKIDINAVAALPDGVISNSLQALTLETNEDREKAMRLFKLVTRFVTMNVVRMYHSAGLSEYFQLLPLCAVLQSNDTDDEIAPICSSLLAVLAHNVTIEIYMPAALEAIRKVTTCPFWSARSVITEFMSVFVFHNMATILSKPEWVLEIQDLVLLLLEDSQPEVRISASHVLSGLFHCQFLPNQMDLLRIFKEKAKTKLKNKSKPIKDLSLSIPGGSSTPKSGSLVNNPLRQRHAGVLGLCALISSHPYDVPDYLPDVFGQLGAHLNDPQPIPSTIRKTLGDFKRTHHENWQVHKLKFTEEELMILSDLTVPLSYYA